MTKRLNRIMRKDVTVYIFTVLCAIAMSLQCSDNPFNPGFSYIDSSVFRYVAKVILRGGMPYRDTFDHKGPLIYLLNAFGMTVNKHIGVWMIELLFIYGILLFAYKIAKLLDCNNIHCMIVVFLSMLSLSTFFEGGNYTEEYACLFIMVSLYIFLKYFKEGETTTKSLFFCGFSFGAVCLLKLNMIALWITMCIGVLFFSLMRKEGFNLIRYILLFFSGAATIILPVLLWLFINHAFIPFIEDYLLFNSKYTYFSLRDFIIIAKYFIRNAPMLFCIPVLIYHCLKYKNPVDYLCLAALFLSIVVICIPGRSFTHYGMILVPYVAYTMSRISIGLFEGNNGIVITAIFMVIIIGLFHTTELKFARQITVILRNPQSINEPCQYKVADTIKKYTDKDDRIIICGNEDIIYLLSDRMAASVYSYQEPISIIDPKIRETFVDDIRSMKAKIIVVSESSRFYPDIEDVIINHYTLLDKIQYFNIYCLN